MLSYMSSPCSPVLLPSATPTARPPTAEPGEDELSCDELYWYRAVFSRVGAPDVQGKSRAELFSQAQASLSKLTTAQLKKVLALQWTMNYADSSSAESLLEGNQQYSEGHAVEIGSVLTVKRIAFHSDLPPWVSTKLQFEQESFSSHLISQSMDPPPTLYYAIRSP